MATIFETPAELAASAGKHLGHSAWMEVTQERIQLFADATDDQQWIHVDPARAAQELGWRPTVDFGALVRMMVDADLKRLGAGPP